MRKTTGILALLSFLVIPCRAPAHAAALQEAGGGPEFETTGVLGANKLGLCYLNLADGYPTVTRNLNFEPQPLDVYKRSLPLMNYRHFDDVWVTRNPVSGVVQDLGPLDGKRVYSIGYSGGLHAILVERQSGRFLPVMYFSPQTTIDRLEIVKAFDRQILAYSSTISGNGGFTDDWYFILDHGIPKRVEYEAILVDELKKLFPEIERERPRGNFILSGRSFDVAKLTFTSPVWKDEDSNDSPIESVTVVFEIRNGQFVIKSSHRGKLK
jgi:hypothetical protein